MRGTSCSGKDTFIQKHFNQDGSASYNIVSTDDMRMLLLGTMTDISKNHIVFEFCHNIVRQRLANMLDFTVFNATNLQFKDVKPLLDIADETGTSVTVVSIIPPSVDILIERSYGRSQSGGLFIPQEALIKHHFRYEACKPAFIEHARKNMHKFKWVEVDQEWNVVNEI